STARQPRGGQGRLVFTEVGSSENRLLMLLMHEIRDFHPLLCRSDIELFGGAAWEGARPATRKDSAGECDSEANQRKSQGGGKPRPIGVKLSQTGWKPTRGERCWDDQSARRWNGQQPG